MSTSPVLPPFVEPGRTAEEKKDEVRYARLWADCVEVGGEWLTEEKWRGAARAEGLLPSSDEFHLTRDRRNKARRNRLTQLNRKALALEKLIRRQPWRRRGAR